jgi:hypothetical protein
MVFIPAVAMPFDHTSTALSMKTTVFLRIAILSEAGIFLPIYTVSSSIADH